MIQKIATVAIYVEDQHKAKTFWTEKVGFEVVRETPMGPNAFWLEVAPPGAQSALVIYPRSMMKNYAELKPSIVFVTENIQATYERMKSKGVEFEGELQEMQWGTFATFKDEDGHSFLIKG
ncbi:VOC family protein [Paenibacillus aceris]|uniref:Catechol 2,3-dioxygenase-like lactoylglutathione lyase family enzyme n=1 Tax=Paenibacillus aceris TaxID=869555 RepID=A0ABS4IB49_9BACL|nr:VOC family protein [Paenibacillus aceris]MBP1967596.1 catechol 2,3-dioxygenase-like lactoylglutathione lyase family enzyme [Paenibacillus aceris]NHW39145.1 VOC family protein [Paenibacillus aceris]